MEIVSENINALALQSNALVRSKLNFSHIEARIFGLALGCVHTTHTELPPISIAVKDVVPANLGGTQYAVIKEAMHSLIKKTASIEKVTGKRSTYTAYSLIDTLAYDTGTGLITGAFAHAISPFLLQLKSQFTVVEIQTLLTLKSAHAHRLYWYLKSWEKPHGTCKVKFDKFREIMLGEDCGDSYALYNRFKVHVLEPAIAELHRLEPVWPVEFVEKKRGRKVDELVFTIPEQDIKELESKPDEKKTKTKLTIDEIETFREWIFNNRGENYLRQYDMMQLVYKLTEYQARTVIKGLNHAAPKDITALVSVLEAVKADIKSRVPMKSVGGWTLGKVKAAFPNLFANKK